MISTISVPKEDVPLIERYFRVKNPRQDVAMLNAVVDIEIYQEDVPKLVKLFVKVLKLENEGRIIQMYPEKQAA